MTPFLITNNSGTSSCMIFSMKAIFGAFAVLELLHLFKLKIKHRLRVTVQKVFVSITRLVHMQHHPWTERVILAFYNDNKYDKYGTWVAFSICSMLHNALIKCHISVTCSPHNGIHQKCVCVHYDYLLKMVYSLLILLYIFETHTHTNNYKQAISRFRNSLLYNS